MSTSPQCRQERSKIKYPTEIFDVQHSPPSLAHEAQERISRAPHEHVPASLRAHRLSSVHADLESDSDESMLEWSDAGSWHSAQSSVDHDDESIQPPAPTPIVENDNPYFRATVDVALSRFSMNDSSRPRRSVHAEDLADDYDTMSITDIDPRETHANSSWVATDSFGTSIDSNEDRNYEGSFTHSSSSSIFTRNELSPGGANATPSSSRRPASGRVLTSAQCSIIEHSDKHANWFDKYGVPWSAQWHIAVLLSNKRKEWDQITEKDIKALSGTNTIVGPKIPGVLFPNDRRRALDNRTPSRLGDLYVELDKEEAALNKGSLETLGLSSQSEDTTHLSIGTWWGGRIEQRAVIVRSNAHVTPHPSMCRGAPPPKTCWSIQLRHQAIRGKSCRFTRQFGSRRFIQLGLPEDLTQDERSSLKEELLKPYLLHGRVFRAFSAQDGTVRLVETDENVGRIARPEAGDSRRLSFRQFLDWFNPLERNAAQLSSKWSARFKLGLSSSQPVVVFETANIHFIDDIPPKSQNRTKYGPPNKHVMNDGCGLINRAALKSIQRQKGLQGLPTALQGRIAGAKGLWILDPNDQEDRPHIWITASQVKIHYTREELDEDPSRRILDLLRVAQVKEPVRLSTQPIVNLAHNGVPHTVFTELLQESLKSSIDHVLDEWESDDAVAMWSRVFKESGVGNIRKRRYEKFSERSFGNVRDTEETEESLGTSDGLVPFGDVHSFHTSGPDPNSGWPTELAEQVVELFQAGFIPSKCSYLASLLKSYLKMEVKRITEGCHIPIKHSAEVFAAPDFSGTLKPGEVFFRSSQQCALLDDPTITDNVLLGDIIIFRFPIKVPSDARLVTAVDYPQLREFTDVLLFSVLEERPQASILAGGDYDGDTICMIAEPRLVNTFRNSDLDFADPPAGFKKHVEPAVRSGREILNKMSSLDEAERIRELQLVLLDTLTREDHCGSYSIMSDIATYIYGYDSVKTHYLSYMHFNELDAAKSGIHVKQDVWRKDFKEFRYLDQPACMRKPESKRRRRDKKQLQKLEPERPQYLGPFVFDVLSPFAKTQEERYIRLIDNLDFDAAADCDPALLAPLHSADRRASLLRDEGHRGMWNELERLKAFVKLNRESWANLFLPKRNFPTSIPGSHLTRTGSQDLSLSPLRDFFDLPKTVQIQGKREISDEFWNGFQTQLKYFDEDEAKRIMCSYAYHHAGEKAQAARAHGRKGSLEYAFNVGFKTLAELKGRAHGGLYSTCVEPFHDLMVPRRGVLNEGQM